MRMNSKTTTMKLSSAMWLNGIVRGVTTPQWSLIWPAPRTLCLEHSTGNFCDSFVEQAFGATASNRRVPMDSPCHQFLDRGAIAERSSVAKVKSSLFRLYYAIRYRSLDPVLTYILPPIALTKTNFVNCISSFAYISQAWDSD
ncbi:hypothetical protein M433DRAFT_488406 [Acidomyces richmondensis BFW]|nr:MAG: hypothetical protein FE78DRAFT_285757 [Acidomyces sp. 'richmondensis']KYG47607.1 hypothetical protein M433DRAFT_488406 [Acidomyces richmondensis BFW]